MVTVSQNFNNYEKNPVYSGSFSASTNAKAYIEKNFQAKNQDGKKKNEIANLKEDTLIKDTLKNRLKINWDKTTAIPLVHFPRGLGGAQDYTFFEFLQTAKFPYYVGGPILAALFYAGIKKDNFQSAKAAKGVAKHIALGVGLYYVGAALAKSIVNTTVRASRGINLNQPYSKAISTSTNQTGVFKKDSEYHKLFESVDFTYWQLLHKKGDTPEAINENYKKIGRKYGIKEDTNDIDSTVKPLIKKTIVMARAWQYALTAFFVTLGIGMANQPAWTNEANVGFKETIKKGIFGKNVQMKERLHGAKIAVYDYMLKPFGKSFGEFWKGHNTSSSIAGKSVILSTVAATILAITLLLKKTTGKKHEIETSQANKTSEVNK